jgi:hypothetical protein
MRGLWVLASFLAGGIFGCTGNPRLSVKNTFPGTVFYEITIAGDPAAYLSGHMGGNGSKTLTLEAGRNLLIFVQPDTTGGQQNFVTLDSLLAEEGKKYLLELNPQYVSGHQHGSSRLLPREPVETQSRRNFLR